MTGPDLLYRLDDVPDALTVPLTAQLPERVTVHPRVLGTDTTAPYVLVTTGSPRYSGPPMAGDQRAHVTVHLLAVGRDLSESAKTMDLAREVLLGRDRRGAFVHPIVLTDREVLQRTGGGDTVSDASTGVPQTSESLTLTIGRSA